MPLGYLAALTARLPGWIGMIVKRDEYDLNGPDAAAYKPQPQPTAGDLVKLLEPAVSEARDALANTTDEHLMKSWRFMVSGHIASGLPRHVMIRDAVFSHLAHHRGQLTVYLRLNEAAVPAIYGPSADETGF